MSQLQQFRCGSRRMISGQLLRSQKKRRQVLLSSVTPNMGRPTNTFSTLTYALLQLWITLYPYINKFHKRVFVLSPTKVVKISRELFFTYTKTLHIFNVYNLMSWDICIHLNKPSPRSREEAHSHHLGQFPVCFVSGDVYVHISNSDAVSLHKNMLPFVKSQLEGIYLD